MSFYDHYSRWVRQSPLAMLLQAGSELARCGLSGSMIFSGTIEERLVLLNEP